jgi:hypothetical protein
MAVSTIDPAGLNIGQIGGRRNLVINGAMQVAQRGTSTSSTTSGYRGGPDRCYFNHDNYGTVTISQDTNAPKGFSKSMKVACTTADASPAAGDNLIFIHFIEAQDLQHLNYGSSDAVSTTVSFWVKTNTTGTHNFTLFTQDGTVQTIHFEYTVNAADTWEYKSFVIPANTSATINDDTGRGLQLEWFLGGGSDFTGGTADETWGSVANNKRNTSGRTLCSSTSNYWQITGIQFEVSPSGEPTPFEHRSYGEELSACQRYYWRWYNGTTLFQGYPVIDADGTRRNTVIWPVEMRASPSLTVTWSGGSPGTQYVSKQSGQVYITGGSAGTEYSVSLLVADAEL